MTLYEKIIKSKASSDKIVQNFHIYGPVELEIIELL